MSAVVGALISSVRETCRAGMLDWSPRIKLAMYTCDIQASSGCWGTMGGGQELTLSGRAWEGVCGRGEAESQDRQ